MEGISIREITGIRNERVGVHGGGTRASWRVPELYGVAPELHGVVPELHGRGQRTQEPHGGGPRDERA